MALITTLRQKMGTVLVVVVGLSIVSFVLTDLLNQNSSSGLINQTDNTVGEIAGEEIPYEVYNAEVNRLADEFELQYGFRPQEAQMNGIRQNAWELMFVEYALSEEYAALGIQVTAEELKDMVQGPESNIDPGILQAFTQDGVFQRERLMAYLASIKNDPVQLAGWASYENTLTQSRARLKYESLLLKSDYVTDLEGKNSFLEQVSTADVKYLYVPFYNIADSTITAPSDAELKGYISEHADEYTRDEEFRDVVYVEFPIVPSTDDSTFYSEDLKTLKADFEQSTNDSLFASNNSDAIRSAYLTLKPNNLPPALQDQELYEGLIVGPAFNATAQTPLVSLYKVSAIVEDTVASAKARHILIKSDDNTDVAKRAARRQAQDIINQLRNGADFAEMARIHGTDGTASRGGELGWFSTGQMVAEFQEAVFNRNSPGLINRPVETQFGFHIIDVQETANNRAYKIAAIDREMVARAGTTNDLYRQADNFRSESSDLETMKARAEELGLTVLEGNNVGSLATSIGALTDAREAVQWLFRESDYDKVSGVLEVNDRYVVAMLTGIKETGLQSVEEVRESVAQRILEEKKADLIKERIMAAGEKSLDDLATEMGLGAAVYTNPNLKLSENTLSIAGEAPAAIGAAFGLEAGEKSGPITAKNGVVVIELNTINIPSERADYSSYKNQLLSNLQANTSGKITDAVKESADIKDERYKFY